MTRLFTGRSRLVVVLLLLAPLGPAPARGNGRDPAEAQKARDLVRRLGDDSFPVREAASKQLLKMGLAVKQVLLEGSRDPDPEVRRRCRELLPAVLEADRRARLKAFLDDKEGKKKHDLPGWEAYRKLVGQDAAARELFAAVQKSEAVHFLEDAARSPKRAGDLVQARCQVLQTRLFFQPGRVPQQVKNEELAPLFLVACDERVTLSPVGVSILSSLLYQQAPRAALAAPGASPFKKLVIAWMGRQTDDFAVQQMLNLANSLNMKEGLDIAVKVIRGKKVKGYGLAAALTTVGKLGTKDHVGVLEPFLTDKTLIGNFAFNQVRGTTELRDVALAMLVHLTGQSHKEYGFVFLDSNPWMKFQPTFLGFSSAEQRDKAFRKWNGWSAAHKAKTKK